MHFYSFIDMLKYVYILIFIAEYFTQKTIKVSRKSETKYVKTK